MLKTFTILLTIMALAICVVPKIDASDSSKTLVVSMQAVDLRAQALRNVFERHNSPLFAYADSYVQTADKYGVDWELLPAISGLESSFGIHQLSGSYNSYGWGGGRLYFKSVDDGIDIVLSNLKNKYMARGATTVETIAPIYSESPTWAPRVRHFINEIDFEYQKIQNSKLILTI